MRREWLSRSGLIPTCVGSTLRSPAAYPLTAAHPHMRGEHYLCSGPRSRRWGSSPHAWGAPAACVVDVTDVGLIPTCVGSTKNVVQMFAERGAHPHMRGEHMRGSGAT